VAGQQQQGNEEEELVMADEVILVLPSRVRLDLGRLMACAHHRVRDDKAPVRKVGMRECWGHRGWGEA
jgi:hypothetical protein